MQKLTLSILFFLCVFTINAQKIGHINLGNLLEALPAAQSADTQLKSFAQSKETEFKALTEKYMAKVDQLNKDAQSSQYAPKELQERQAKLEQERQELLATDGRMQDEIQLKRQELLAPIFDNISATVDAYGNANGYNYILDSSIPNFMLFENGDDLTETIKGKL